MLSDIQKKLYLVLQFIQNNKHSKFYKDLSSVQSETSEIKVDTLPTTTIKNLMTYSGNLSHYPEKDIRYLISEFSSNNIESLFLVPRKIDDSWDLLEDEIKKNDPMVGILILPLSWQVGPIFYQTCRKNSVPVSVLNPRNLPLAKQVIKETEAQLIVTTPKIAGELYSLLSEGGMDNQIQTWHLIVPVGQTPQIPKLSGDVNVEYHLFPGIPIGHIPSDLLKEKVEGFLPSPDFFFEIHNKKCFITSLETQAIPFIRLEISRNAQESMYKNKNIITINENT